MCAMVVTQPAAALCNGSSSNPVTSQIRGVLLHTPASPASSSVTSNIQKNRQRPHCSHVLRGRRQQTGLVAAAAAAELTTPVHGESASPQFSSQGWNHVSDTSVSSPLQQKQPQPAPHAASVVTDVLFLRNKKRPMRNRRIDRATCVALQQQYSEVLQAFKSEYEGWLHDQEDEIMQMQAANMNSSAVHHRTAQHDRLKRAWEDKWGAPVNPQGNKLYLLPQARALTLGFINAQQQQQQQHAVRPEQRHDQAAQLQQTQQQQQQQPPASSQSSSSQEGLAVPCNSTEHGTNEQRRGHIKKDVASTASTSRSQSVGSSALDIPDDTPELVAEAAAATEAAGQRGSSNSQAAGAALIIQAICSEPIDRDFLDGIEVVFLHLTLPKLVYYGMPDKLPVLARYILSRSDRNEHSFGAVFDAYARANRLDLALSTWDQLASQGVDIGPIGSSALIKACARSMDLSTAQQVFEQLLRRRVTFNSYTYHCLLQLCGSAGSMDDALAVYNLQRLETQPANLPNSLTYLALTRAMLVSGRYELVQQLFENMLEDQIQPHPALYCNFLTAAGRAADLSLARYMYQHMAVTLGLPQCSPVPTQGLLPAVDLQNQAQESIPASAAVSAHASASSMDRNSSGWGDGAGGDTADLLLLVNALLNAHAQVGALPGAVYIYKQELLGRRLKPDGYTCTALLTAAARMTAGRLSWAQVAAIVDLTTHYNIYLSTQLGTALINAYRKVKCWDDQPQLPQQQNKGVTSRRGGRRRQKQQQQQAAEDSDTSMVGTGSAELDSGEQEQQHQAQLQQLTDHEAVAEADIEQQHLAVMGAVQLPGLPAVVCAALHAARQVLDTLHELKLASSSSYVVMMCFYLEQGQLTAFKQLYHGVTEQQGILIDGQGWERLMAAAEECGAGALVASLQQQQHHQRFQGQQQQQQQQRHTAQPEQQQQLRQVLDQQRQRMLKLQQQVDKVLSPAARR